MRHLQRLTRLEQVVSHRRAEQPPAEPTEPPALLESLRLFRYGYGEPGPLGIRAGSDGDRHIVVTDVRHTDWLADVAARFDMEWHAAGCLRLLLMTREETAAAVAAIDRGDLVYRPHEYTGSLLWWGCDGSRLPYAEMNLIDDAARVLIDQGETVNSLADLRSLLTEALLQPD